MADQPSGKGIQSTLLFPPWVALSRLDPLLQSFMHPREGAVQGRRWDPVLQASSDGTLTGQLRYWQSLQFSRFFRAPAPTPRPGTGAFWHLCRHITVSISSVSSFPRYPVILTAPLMRSGPLTTACLAPGLHFFAPTDSRSTYSCFSLSPSPAAAPANAFPGNWSDCSSTIQVLHSSLFWTKGSFQWEKGMAWTTQGNFLSVFL